MLYKVGWWFPCFWNICSGIFSLIMLKITYDTHLNQSLPYRKQWNNIIFEKLWYWQFPTHANNHYISSDRKPKAIKTETRRMLIKIVSRKLAINLVLWCDIKSMINEAAVFTWKLSSCAGRRAVLCTSHFGPVQIVNHTCRNIALQLASFCTVCVGILKSVTVRA